MPSRIEDELLHLVSFSEKKERKGKEREKKKRPIKLLWVLEATYSTPKNTALVRLQGGGMQGGQF